MGKRLGLDAWWKDWGPTFKEGWCGSLNLIREVKLCADNTLQFIPIEEYETLRYGKTTEYALTVPEEIYEINSIDGVSFEMELTVDLVNTTADSFTLFLRSNGTNQTEVNFDLKHQTLTLSRENADNWSAGITKSTLKLIDKHTLYVRIFSDQSSVELFTDEYKTAHSINVFASSQQNRNYILASGGKLAITELTTYGLMKSMDCKKEDREIIYAFPDSANIL